MFGDGCRMRSLVLVCRDQLSDKQDKILNKVIRNKNLKPKGEMRLKI